MRLLIFIFFTLFGGMLHAQTIGLEWVKAIDGDVYQAGLFVVTDDSGNVYTAGNYGGTIDFDPGPDTLNLTAVDLFDFYVQKLDTNGDLVWAISLGGVNSESVTAITIDNFNHLYVAGEFYNQVDFDPGPGISTLTPPSGRAMFILQLNLDGEYQWVKKMEATWSSGVECHSMAADSIGNLYCTGYFQGDANLNPTGQTGWPQNIITANGQADAYVQKLDSNGTLIWVFPLGLSGFQRGREIHIDKFGDIYIAGSHSGLIDIDLGPGVTYLNGNGSVDMFVVKIDAAMNVLWAHTTGGGLDTYVGAISTDHLGNLHITGTYEYPTDFDPGPGVFTMSPATSFEDIFVQKLDSAGNFIWAKSIGGMSMDLAIGILLDQQGDVYICGRFKMGIDFDPGPGTVNYTANGLYDGYLLNLNSNGDFGWVDVYGGSGSDGVFALTMDGSGNLYITGLYEGLVDFDPGPGTYTMNTSGSDAAFMLKYGVCMNTGIDTVVACDSYTWIDGVTYTASNDTAEYTLSNMTGCDSIVSLDLTIIGPTAGIDVISACDSYTWLDGNVYTSNNNSAMHTITGGSANGCDSILTLNLTLISSATGIDVISACDSYTWLDGNVYYADNTSSTHTVIGGSANGCDSILTLNLTITHNNTVDVQTACDSYTWINGVTYTTDNNTATFTIDGGASDGCDSTVTLNLSFSSILLSISENETILTALADSVDYQWFNCSTGFIVSGEMNQTFTGLEGETYACIVTDNGCTDTTSCYTIPVGPVGINEYGNGQLLVVHPNPAGNYLTFEFRSAASKLVTIYNTMGQAIAFKKSDELMVVMNTTELVPGLYYFKVQDVSTTRKIGQGKFVKE